MISPHLAERVLLRGSDGGFYYATQFTDASGPGQLWWYGEHTSLAFANVYFGTLEPGWGEAGRFRGHLFDLPKGLTCADFVLDLQIIPGAAGRPPALQQIGGPRRWEVVAPEASAIAEFTRPAGPIPPTFDGEDFDNMTGLYRGDDGGDYYVLEHPSSRLMYWVGLHPAAVPGPTGAAG